ncbi:MAG: FGGY-family carbohydrate kinase [Sediminibacterium sp.]
MSTIPVIAIFDVGRTNKKFLLFDEQYKVVWEESCNLAETIDEDGYPCEDVAALTEWVWTAYWKAINQMKSFDIKAINFSGYGASFVLLDDDYQPFTPLYNYLNPYPEYLHKQFYDTYGGTAHMAQQTASPILGNLNSGMQLYRIKHQKPEVFKKIKYALHLPQYLSFIISSKVGADITSIGCHTGLWNFEKNDYHEWVYKEGLITKLAPIFQGDAFVGFSKDGKKIPVGIGLHDSSAALIPYLSNFHEPFILLSTGTWCISLNPFNESLLTEDELKQDCVSFFTYRGKPVKASRLFAGYEHEEQTKRLAAHFNTAVDYYKQIGCDTALLQKLQVSKNKEKIAMSSSAMVQQSPFGQRNLMAFVTYEEAYHQLMLDIIQQQLVSTQLVLKDTRVKRLFVDGGFSNNPIYMHLLAVAFPQIEVFAASVAQASALGAALSVHQHWNSRSLPGDLVALKYYAFS